jgi:hypothetical protein
MLRSPPSGETMDIAIESNKRFHTKAPLDQVFQILSDVPRSVSHYPDVDSLEDLGGGAYQWNLRELGAAGIRHQIVYGCHYVCEAHTGSIRWRPVDGLGNARIAGHWDLTSDAAGTQIDFFNEGTLSIPIPRLLKSVGVPFVQAAFLAQIDTYLANLMRTFEISAA